MSWYNDKRQIWAQWRNMLVNGTTENMALSLSISVLLAFIGIVTCQEVSFEPECTRPTEPARTQSPLPSFNTERIWYSEEELYGLDETEIGCKVGPRDNFFIAFCAASWENIFPWSNATRRIAEVFPNRGLYLGMKFLDNVSHKLLNSELLGPVKNQLVDLEITHADALVTQRIHGSGVLVNLLRLCIKETLKIRVRKIDFSTMANIQVIVFEKSTFALIEPFTFTDLPGLKTLVLEVKFPTIFDEFGYKNRWPVLNSTEALRSLRELHCGCSYTWLRNFLKRKPELVKKNLGETATIGSYKAFSIIDNRPNVLVDCSVETIQDFVEGPGTWTMEPITTYSINTNCQEAVC